MESDARKYPRTMHLPYSEKKGKDDKVLDTDEQFRGEHVVVRVKMDGENTSITSKYVHARSLDSTLDTEDRKWLDTLRMKNSALLADVGLKLCGENMFYKHTIEYPPLALPFYLFSVWDEDGENCLSEDSAIGASVLFKVPMPYMLYYGIYDKDKILKAFNDYKKTNPAEGFVIRRVGCFKYEDFSKNVAKYVSADFEIPSEHWRKSPLSINKFRGVTSPWEF